MSTNICNYCSKNIANIIWNDEKKMYCSEYGAKKESSDFILAKEDLDFCKKYENLCDDCIFTLLTWGTIYEIPDSRYLAEGNPSLGEMKFYSSEILKDKIAGLKKTVTELEAILESR